MLFRSTPSAPKSRVRPPPLPSPPEANPSTGLGDLKLSPSERTWLADRCPFFTTAYLDYLEAFRFRPAEQVVLEFVRVERDAQGVEWGNLELEVKGSWAETILYEVSFVRVRRGGS